MTTVFKHPDMTSYTDGTFILNDEFTYKSPSQPYDKIDHWTFKVPKGFTWHSFNTSPIVWFFWSLFGLHAEGIMTGPQMIRNTLYHPTENPKDCWYTRRDVDKLFRCMMLDAGISRVRAWGAYWTIRLFGRLDWHVRDFC